MKGFRLISSWSTGPSWNGSPATVLMDNQTKRNRKENNTRQTRVKMVPKKNAEKQIVNKSKDSFAVAK